MGRYAVFGQPIAHSLSPRIHAAFGAQLGIALDYRAIEAGRDGFAARVAAFARDGGRGANVTLPLKQDALVLCADLSERARRAGSVNTLIRVGDGWHGDSTDGAGLLRDLRERHGFDSCGRRVLLLGAGGAARAAAFAFADAGASELAIANRTFDRAAELAQAIGDAARAVALDELEALGRFDLVVNATAAGHAGTSAALPRSLLDADALCYDLSYGKAAQAFLDAARRAGASRASDGLGMLVEQAAESFAVWHGTRPETAAVYAALREG
ncbi:shikimate dehydrogenase [Dokdonella sp.]|uniref:shikimate dehydrogenase n=1 Tax=Dokdonella sp. TaxID=2291710 RepID=UPI0025C0A3A3|nr:shikimate dehydrogenase [Dokdonella sp.]